MPSEFHGIRLGDGRIRFGATDAPLAGVRALVRDEGSTRQEVTAAGLGRAALAMLFTDQIDWTLTERVPTGQVVVVVVGEDFAFEVPVDARERRAAKEFVVAIRMAVKAAEAAD